MARCLRSSRALEHTIDRRRSPARSFADHSDISSPNWNTLKGTRMESIDLRLLKRNGRGLMHHLRFQCLATIAVLAACSGPATPPVASTARALEPWAKL